METHRPAPGPRRRLRLPRRTARLRLTILYGAAFLACGAAVLALTYLLYGGAVHFAGVRVGPVFQHVVRAPAADVHRDGRYDVITIPLTPRQSQAAARQANLGQMASDRRQLLVASAIALAAFAVAATAIGWLLAGRVLRPLSTMTAAARRISASSLHERLDLHGPDDELKELADTLDHLFARLETSFDAQRRFAANASHELRTPLTRERTLLQVTLADPASTAGTWQAVSRELLASNAEQERLIEALLTLASSETEAGEREPVDLAAVTSAALAAASPAISRLRLDVRADIQPARTDGDPLLIQQLAANLLANAVGHNVPGGEVEVATGVSDSQAFLSVANTGPVIPAAEVDRLFQPFQRLGQRPARRDSHGLGLSIVRAIATAHAATIEARARPGGGLTIEVAFPPSPGRAPRAAQDQARSRPRSRPWRLRSPGGGPARRSRR